MRSLVLTGYLLHTWYGDECDAWLGIHEFNLEEDITRQNSLSSVDCAHYAVQFAL